jgi:hypothetical protein
MVLPRSVCGYPEVLQCTVDLGTDLATMAYYATVNPVIAMVQGGVLVFSFVSQFTVSIALGQPLWVGLMGLVGMKPAVEAWREATGAEPFVDQKLGNDFMVWTCRMVEMVVSGCRIGLVRCSL